MDPINSEWYNLCHGESDKNKKRAVEEIAAAPYEYCYDNPIMYDDPTGEQPPREKRYRLFLSSNNNTTPESESFYSMKRRGSFFEAAYKVQQEFIKRYGEEGVGKIQKIYFGLDIVSYINQQPDNSIQSLDYFGHASPTGLHFQRYSVDGTKVTPANHESIKQVKNSLYSNNNVQRKALDEKMADPYNGSVTIESIDARKFRKDARIEIHGCDVAGDPRFPVPITDNFAALVSARLYQEGKKEAVVIAHFDGSFPNPNLPGYADYRHGERQIFWNGNVIFTTTAIGHIDDATIRNAIQYFKTNGKQLIENQSNEKNANSKKSN